MLAVVPDTPPHLADACQHLGTCPRCVAGDGCWIASTSEHMRIALAAGDAQQLAAFYTMAAELVLQGVPGCLVAGPAPAPLTLVAGGE